MKHPYPEFQQQESINPQTGPKAYVSVEAAPAQHLAALALRTAAELQQPLHRTKPILGGFHITLRYLGPSTDAQLRAMLEVCNLVELREGPITLRLSKFAGYFRNHQDPRATWIWAGVAGDTLALQRCRDNLDLAANLAGYADALFPLTPHITIATARSHSAGASTIQSVCRKIGTGILPLEWCVSRINLMVKLTEHPQWQEYTAHPNQTAPAFG